MAEFQEVYRQYKRMCTGVQGCNNCDLRKYKNSIAYIGSCSQFLKGHPQEAEGVIMKWAAEHPEPVYPTWEEWLITQGVIKKNPNNIGWPMPKLLERIPTDIAEKLGIRPKEG